MKLERGAVNLLSGMLSAKGWYEGNVPAAFAAGELLVKVMPDLKGQQPPAEDIDKLRAWLGEEFEITISPMHRQAINICLLFHLKHGLLPINLYSYKLMTEFGLDLERT